MNDLLNPGLKRNDIPANIISLCSHATSLHYSTLRETQKKILYSVWRIQQQQRSCHFCCELRRGVPGGGSLKSWHYHSFHSASACAWSIIMDFFKSFYTWKLLGKEECLFVLFYLVIVVQIRISFIYSESILLS